MATKLDVMNNLMRRLREPEVAKTSSSQYAKLISEIVAQSYEEVLDEWNWRAVSETVVMEVPANARGGPMADFVVSGFAVPDARAFLTREHGVPYARVFNLPYAPGMIESNSSYRMTELTLRDFSDITSREISEPQEYIEYFTLRPKPDETMEIYFHNVPKNVNTIQMVFYRRPALLAPDDSSDNTQLEIPYRPVQELALMYALNERGEEMGEPGNLAQGRYIQALAAAKELDIKAGEHANNFDWGRD